MVKKLFLLLMLAVGGVHAQTSALVGVTGGSSFGNLFLGATGGLQATISKRYDFTLKDTFSPLESHIQLGNGWANSASVSPTVWLKPRVGLTGEIDLSSYSVTKVSKTSSYAFGGIALKSGDVRYNLEYIQQFNNGISKNGTESSRLQGGRFEMILKYGCAKKFCYITDFTFDVGHVLTQGNQACDGSLGVYIPSCKRGGAWAGSFIGSLYLQVPR